MISISPHHPGVAVCHEATLAVRSTRSEAVRQSMEEALCEDTGPACPARAIDRHFQLLLWCRLATLSTETR